MATLKNYMVGRHWTAVALTPISVGTDAIATAVTASAVTITALIDGVSQSLRGTNEEISAANATRENYEHIIDGHYQTFTHLVRNDNNDPDPLQTLIASYDVFQFSYTYGTAGSAKTVTGYGRRADYQMGLQGKGRQVATLVLDPIDVGTASYVRA